MPEIAVCNSQIITASDIYKFNLSKEGPFTCLNCDKPLQFRQSRNAEKSYTEHFYHPNNIKNTHIECETNTLERLRDNDTWHNKVSNFIDLENREIIRSMNNVKHIVDAYDPLNDMGIEFQNSPISVEAIQSRDTLTHLDWIFNVQNQYLRKVKIGNRVICEIPHENWEKAVKVVKNKVYLFTGNKEWVLLEDRESYRIEVEGLLRNVWIGKPVSFQKLHDETVLQNILTKEGLEYFQTIDNETKKVGIIYARCKKSMYLLDGIHRRYINRHIFQMNDILAIKSVAGSGKTTTLLELAKIHSDKKILYLAFNRSLIDEINMKIKNQNIKNMFPLTFDKLLHTLYIMVKKREPTIVDLTPQSIKEIIPWFKGKPFQLRKYYVDLYTRFCQNDKYTIPEEFCKKTINKFSIKTEVSFLNSLWNKTLNHQLLTFQNLRKLSVNQHWFKDNLDKIYDMVFIDETQDFDIMMLKMLLEDTKLPKVFVGDPKQSIYKWRGSINAFNYLPLSSLIVEFYSTFRIGDPACEEIRKKFKDCWMVAKNENNTLLSSDKTILQGEKYSYLFRTWRNLLVTASEQKDIWICNFRDQVEKMRKLHATLSTFQDNNDEEFPDDLPMFLRSLTKEQLENLVDKIDVNIVSKAESKYKFYTIHAYKGLEDDNIRISSDLDKDNDENLYYVALTRGRKKILQD